MEGTEDMREKRRAALRKKLFMICLVLILAIICMIIIPFNRFRVAAGEKNCSDIQYKTYVVHSGDTLWGIADTYMEGIFDSHQAYIDEVMRANGLNSSHIYDGQLIIIPCEESVYMTITASEQTE